MKSFDEFGVENCKMVLIEECPCQNRKQLEKGDGKLLKVKRAAITDVLLVGQKKIAMRQGSITLKKRKGTKYSNREY